MMESSTSQGRSNARSRSADDFLRARLWYWTSFVQPSAAVINGILYVVGGSGPPGTDVATMEAYDPATNTWTAKAGMPTARMDPAAGVVNGILYVIGGFAYGAPDYLATLEAYRP